MLFKRDEITLFSVCKLFHNVCHALTETRVASVETRGCVVSSGRRDFITCACLS